MKNTLKSLVAVLIAPVILVGCFQTNVIKSKTLRAPAVVVQDTTLKQDVSRYLKSL